MIPSGLDSTIEHNRNKCKHVVALLCRPLHVVSLIAELANSHARQTLKTTIKHGHVRGRQPGVIGEIRFVEEIFGLAV